MSDTTLIQRLKAFRGLWLGDGMHPSVERQKVIDALEQQAAQIEAAIPAMREYARMNPKHHFSTDGIEQDPNGAHAWLARNDAALRQEQPT